MNRQQALRLPIGTELTCTDTEDWRSGTRFWVGELIRVVNKGAEVRITAGKCPRNDWCGPGTGPNAGEILTFPFKHLTARR